MKSELQSPPLISRNLHFATNAIVESRFYELEIFQQFGFC